MVCLFVIKLLDRFKKIANEKLTFLYLLGVTWAIIIIIIINNFAMGTGFMWVK